MELKAIIEMVTRKTTERPIANVRTVILGSNPKLVPK
jgi:hypothetical protein